MEKVIFSVAHRNSKATIHWNLDDDYLGSTVDIHKITIQPQPGEHRLTLVDDNGFRLSVPFEILE
jgi:penicillin-binding protein 1C